MLYAHNTRHALVDSRVEGIVAGTLRGQIALDDNKHTTLCLQADGELIQQVSAKPLLSDNARSTNDRFEFSFEFDLNALGAERNVTYQLIHEASGYDFSGARWSYCKATALAVEQHRDVLRRLFYAEYYRFHYSLVHHSNTEAFEYYFQNGIYCGHAPCPWFSTEYVQSNHGDLIADDELPVISYARNRHRLDVRPSVLFDPEYYARTNPELEHHSMLEHHIRNGNARGTHTIERRIAEPVLAELKEMSQIEPSIGLIRSGPRSLVRLGFPTPAYYVPYLVQRRFDSDIKAIICVPDIASSEADSIGMHLLHAYQTAMGHKHVLLIVTEASEQTLPEGLNDKTRVLCLENETRFAHHAEKTRTLHDIIGKLAPQRIVNVNSLATWDVYRKYGSQLSSFLSLDAYVFRFDQCVEGQLAGYVSDYVPDLIEQLDNVYCDNQTIIDQVRKLYGFSRLDMAKFHVLYVPALDDMVQKSAPCTPITAHSEVQSRSILWIGYLSDYKRVDLLIDIANAMPSQNFVVYGPQGDSDLATSLISGTYPNIEYRGAYSNIGDIHVEDFSMYLNTSTWEGLPHTIIQMVGLGVPVVTSSSGGIAELIDVTTGWPVTDNESTIDYVTQISSVLIQTSKAREKANNGLNRFTDRHTRKAFSSRLRELGLQ